MNISVLDCTLRDGGLGLEDAQKNNIASICFSRTDIADIADRLTASGMEIIELGSVEITDDDRTGFAIYPDIQSISKTMPSEKSSHQLFAALYRGPDTPIEEIPDWNESLCEAVRVIIRYSELQKSLDFCAALSAKGYKVFVQPMLTMRYSDREIQILINETNRMNAYALYFVDSYGYMQSPDVERLFRIYDRGLKPEIKIGFHAHNNMNLAFGNTLTFLNLGKNRDIIIDACLIGMGQGAGNLQTELIAGYLNQQCKNYAFHKICDACEIVEKYFSQALWGYSVNRMIPALHKAAYKYAVELRNTYKLSYAEIDLLLSGMPQELRQRYTPENVRELLKQNGYAQNAVRK